VETGLKLLPVQDAGVLRIKELIDENKRIQISLGDGGVSGVLLTRY